MIIGHLPAGYLAYATLDRAGLDRALTLGVLLGSVLPDLDMLWFFLIDHGAVHHHTYLTHRPVVWLVLAVAGFVLGRRWLAGIGLGGVLHVFLDSIVGAISWAWPLSDKALPLIVVPATQDHWVLSFLFHWTFLVELIVLGVAITVYLLRGAKT